MAVINEPGSGTDIGQLFLLKAQEKMNKIYWQIGTLFVLGNLVLICYTTFFPFNFSIPKDTSWLSLANGFSIHAEGVTLLDDWIQNIILFIPFGMGLSAILWAHGFTIKRIALISVLAGFGVSLSVESLQLFLPSRVSAAHDLLANTMGSFLGYYIFHLTRKQVFPKLISIKIAIKTRLTNKALIVSLLLYLGGVGIATILLQNRISLANWNTDLVLAVGNEPATNRVWRGKMLNLYFSDRSVTREQALRLLAGEDKLHVLGETLVAEYNPDASGGLSDRLGNLPKLEWVQTMPIIHGKNEQSPGIVQHWMRTMLPVSSLTQKSRNTSELTVGTTIHSQLFDQTKSARIVAISADARNRNFILDQAGTSLVVRLRTPWSGQNARNPEFVIPNVFTDLKSHHLLITFGGRDLRIYIDSTDREYHFSLTPALALYGYILPRRFWRLFAHVVGLFKLVSCTLISMPILFMGLILLKRRFTVVGAR